MELFGKTDNWREIYKHTSLTFFFYTLNDVSKRFWEEKKYLWRYEVHNSAKWPFNYFQKKCSEKGILRNIKSTWKNRIF